MCLRQESRYASIFICLQIMLQEQIPPVTTATGFSLYGTLPSAGGIHTLQVISNTKYLHLDEHFFFFCRLHTVYSSVEGKCGATLISGCRGNIHIYLENPCVFAHSCVSVSVIGKHA